MVDTTIGGGGPTTPDYNVVGGDISQVGNIMATKNKVLTGQDDTVSKSSATNIKATSNDPSNPTLELYGPFNLGKVTHDSAGNPALSPSVLVAITRLAQEMITNYNFMAEVSGQFTATSIDGIWKTMIDQCESIMEQAELQKDQYQDMAYCAIAGAILTFVGAVASLGMSMKSYANETEISNLSKTSEEGVSAGSTGDKITKDDVPDEQIAKAMPSKEDFLARTENDTTGTSTNTSEQDAAKSSVKESEVKTAQQKTATQKADQTQSDNENNLDTDKSADKISKKETSDTVKGKVKSDGTVTGEGQESKVGKEGTGIQAKKQARIDELKNSSAKIKIAHDALQGLVSAGFFSKITEAASNWIQAKYVVPIALQQQRQERDKAMEQIWKSLLEKVGQDLQAAASGGQSIADFLSKFADELSRAIRVSKG